MASILEKIAIGIGTQGSRGTANSSVDGATGLIVAAATGNDATGIFLRDPGDLDMDFSRLELEGGTFTGLTAHASRVTGSFKRVEPALSFTIDVRGSGVVSGNPVVDNDLDLPEYLQRILEMGGMAEGTSTSSVTPYEFGGVQVYNTLKVWRNGESWTLTGCRADLSWAFTAGEKARLTVTVIADSVVYDASDAFPSTAAATAYGTQLDAPPVLQLANATLDGDTRGFQSATLAIVYDSEDFQDSNLIDGIVTDAGRRNVTFTGDYIVDSGQSSTDFGKLTQAIDSSGTSPILPMTFLCGQATGTATAQNAIKFDIPNLRVTEHSKVDQAKMVRTIAGYAVIAGSSGDGSADQEELVVSGI